MLALQLTAAGVCVYKLSLTNRPAGFWRVNLELQFAGLCFSYSHVVVIDFVVMTNCLVCMRFCGRSGVGVTR